MGGCVGCRTSRSCEAGTAIEEAYHQVDGHIGLSFNKMTDDFLRDALPLSRSILNFRGEKGRWPNNSDELDLFLKCETYSLAASDRALISKYTIKIVEFADKTVAIAKSKDPKVPEMTIDLQGP
jgi:hypothetical protein